MTDKPKNKNRKKSLVVLSIVKVLLILLTVSYSYSFYVKLDLWKTFNSGNIGNRITIVCNDEDIICKYRCQNGYMHPPAGNEIDMPVNEQVIWSRRKYPYEYDYDYITIQLIKDGMLVGYAKLKVVCVNPDRVRFDAMVVEQKSCNKTVLEVLVRKLFANRV